MTDLGDLRPWGTDGIPTGADSPRPVFGVRSGSAFRAVLAALLSWLATNVGAAADAEKAQTGPFPGKERDWNGFEQYSWDGKIVVIPHQAAEGKPWIIRARFWGHEPQFDLAMVHQGYHLVYCDVSNLFGNQEAVQRWNELYDWLTTEHGFARKVVLEGFSRGGLPVYNWGIANPEKVAAIYGDAPVMDFKSWPGARSKDIHRSYGLSSEVEAKAYPGNPVDNLEPLANAGVPIIHVVGDADEVVPIAENTSLAEKRYTQLGGVFEVIHKPGVGHHPHSLEDPAPLVEFIRKHALPDSSNDHASSSP